MILDSLKKKEGQMTRNHQFHPKWKANKRYPLSTVIQFRIFTIMTIPKNIGTNTKENTIICTKKLADIFIRERSYMTSTATRGQGVLQNLTKSDGVGGGGVKSYLT